MVALPALLAWLTLGGCDRAINGDYRGEPLATLVGQLTIKGGLAIEHEVRLGIAWYPDLAPMEPVPPRAIVTEEVSYTGTFPQSFTFRLYAPPAREALATDLDEPGAPEARAAVGQLFAYEDQDGDGRLTLDPSGYAGDRILGSTAGAGAFDFYTVADRHLVLWVQGGATLDLPGVRPGYNLLHYRDPIAPPEVIPLDTRIPLELTDEPRLGLLACREAYLSPQPEVACGVRIWNTPEVHGYITLHDDNTIEALVQVFAGGGVSAQAQVKVNGANVPRDEAGLVHVLSEAIPNVLHSGVNIVDVNQPGLEPVTLRVVVPARFDIVSPPAGATLQAGQLVHVHWTEAIGASTCVASLELGIAAPTTTEPTAGTSAQIAIPDTEGEGEISVVAYDRISFERNAILGLSRRTTKVTVTR